jgi:hypothetical protein
LQYTGRSWHFLRVSKIAQLLLIHTSHEIYVIEDRSPLFEGVGPQLLHASDYDENA